VWARSHGTLPSVGFHCRVLSWQPRRGAQGPTGWLKATVSATKYKYKTRSWPKIIFFIFSELALKRQVPFTRSIAYANKSSQKLRLGSFWEATYAAGGGRACSIG
jgi:hypothetical protein